jgi:hypothetical protein
VEVKRPILKGIGGFFLPLTACIDSLAVERMAVIKAVTSVVGRIHFG